MDAFHRLSRLSSTVMERASSVWKSALRLWRLYRARPQWLRPRRRGRRVVFWAAATSIAVFLLIRFIIDGGTSWYNAASWYNRHHDAVAPLLTLAAGVAVAGVALARHFAQTNADRQRRITESFSKAVDQLGSDKLEVRLGGIYSLERISKESPAGDYWTVMENLTAFVRERSRRNEAERTSQNFEQRVWHRAYFLWREAGQPDGWADELWAAAAKQDAVGDPPATDIAAVLTVIKRRSKQSRKREASNDWRLDLSGAVLKQANLAGADLARANVGDAHLDGADLSYAHLDGANLSYADLERANVGDAHLDGADLLGAHLERANLRDAHLDGADLSYAHLERADLSYAQLERANLRDAHLDGADLSYADLARANPRDAHLKGANLGGAHLDGADLRGARLDGADLRGAVGLSEWQLAEAHGDAATRLPAGLARPAHWPAPDPSANETA
jgi:uncharacterized protein YjbI with pentapeptide repeats